jgi:hypothetical protein
VRDLFERGDQVLLLDKSPFEQQFAEEDDLALLLLNGFIQVGIRDLPAFLEYFAESCGFYFSCLVTMFRKTELRAGPIFVL